MCQYLFDGVNQNTKRKPKDPHVYFHCMDGQN